ncbi:MAG: hypothetical protein HYU64_08535 [Armatimonadetes bacterium]|nr:hypothetical protein [Armatimonadota bacterium]
MRKCNPYIIILVVFLIGYGLFFLGSTAYFKGYRIFSGEVVVYQYVPDSPSFALAKVRTADGEYLLTAPSIRKMEALQSSLVKKHQCKIVVFGLVQAEPKDRKFKDGVLRCYYYMLF